MLQKDIKVKIPRELHMEIIRIQANENRDYDDACRRAAERIKVNSPGYKRAVKREARRIYKREFMSQMNQARKSIQREEAERMRRHEDHFRVPCSICGEHIYMSNKDSNWNEKQKTLYRAFSDWLHTKCE